MDFVRSKFGTNEPLPVEHFLAGLLCVAFSEFMSFTKFLGLDLHINRIKCLYFFQFTGDDLDQWVANKCADKVDQAFVEANRKGRGVAAFICEPCFVSELLL